MMRSPKLLPWYARKAGVSDERAESLWRRAVRSATVKTGWVGTSQYWGHAMEEFRRLLDAEQATLCTPQGQPLLKTQLRVWQLPLLAMEDMVHQLRANWRTYLDHSTSGAQRKAA